jgi:hypothetical protein
MHVENAKILNQLFIDQSRRTSRYRYAPAEQVRSLMAAAISNAA